MVQCRGKTRNGTRCQRQVSDGFRCHQHQFRSQRGGGDEGDGADGGNGIGSKKELALFFAPWCHWCHQFMDGTNSVWEQLKRKHKQVKFSQIDCDAHPEKAEEFGVQGFPTLFRIQGKDAQLFEGDRNVEELSQFIQS